MDIKAQPPFAPLPVGIEETLAPQSWRVQQNIEALLHLYRSWGYDLISPPVVDQAQCWQQDEDLSLETIQFPDQLSGQQLGLRSDMTAQIMRVVAQRLRPESITRLCYCGEITRARAHSSNDARNSVQIGAEYIGTGGGLESAWLLLQSLLKLGFAPEQIIISLGHALIGRQLLQLAGASVEQQHNYRSQLAKKNIAVCAQLSSAITANSELQRALRELPGCYGDITSLERITELFSGFSAELDSGLDELSSSARLLAQHFQVHIDIADIAGYSYHTGLVFSAHSASVPYCLGRGGAYSINSGCYQSAASGFSLELSKLSRWHADYPVDSKHQAAPALAQCLADKSLLARLDQLRAQGTQVVHANGA